MSKDFNNLPSMEEMQKAINKTMKKFQNETVVSCAESFRRIANKIIADTEEVDGLKPADVLEKIITYADMLIDEHKAE